MIAVAGDIACSPSDPNFNSLRGTASACQMMATPNLLDWPVCSRWVMTSTTAGRTPTFSRHMTRRGVE